MCRRIPNEDIEIPNLEGLKPVLQWHSLTCKLVTPMYGGGVKSTVVDEQMPIRASGIRGQLRFWWRLLAKQKWGLSGQALQKAEFALWGGMGSGEDDGTAGQVYLRVSGLPSSQKISNNLVSYDDKSLSELRYVLFPAYNETNKDLKPHELLNPQGINWQLEFAFSPQLQEDKKQQVIETLQWWASFGGVGFRTRKGLGAVHVTEAVDYPQITQVPTQQEVEDANCKLVQRDANRNGDAISALKTAIKKLRDFRQRPGVGRNQGPGRSRWPEPDALRRIYPPHAHNPQHAPVHSAGNIFARGVFGLPINFHFPGENGLNTMVTPDKGERLASPLILRPVYAGNGQWSAAALALPYEHILQMKVKANNQSCPIWQENAANNIRPINENGGQDPIQAFLNYFAQ